MAHLEGDAFKSVKNSCVQLKCIVAGNFCIQDTRKKWRKENHIIDLIK